jgi:hypothetical protein
MSDLLHINNTKLGKPYVFTGKMATTGQNRHIFVFEFDTQDIPISEIDEWDIQKSDALICDERIVGFQTTLATQSFVPGNVYAPTNLNSNK